MRVLVVEDDADIREVVALTLRELRHDVDAVATGPDALRAINRRKPDLALVDLKLGSSMTGFDLARNIRDAMPDVFLVAMSALAGDEPEAHLAAAGFQRRLVKPFELGALERVLRERAEMPRAAARRG